MKLQRKKQNSDREKLKQEILEENPPLKVLSEEEKEQRWNQIFGTDLDTHPMYQNKIRSTRSLIPRQAHPRRTTPRRFLS